MTSADRPSRPGGGEQASSVSTDAPGCTAITHAEAMASGLAPAERPTTAGGKGTLFLQWGRQKRRQALQQRDDEDFGLGAPADDADLLHL